MQQSFHVNRVSGTSHHLWRDPSSPRTEASKIPGAVQPLVPPLSCADLKEGKREHGQCGVPVPGVVAADLVVVQAGLVLGGLEAFLDRPPTGCQAIRANSSSNPARHSARFNLGGAATA